MRCSKCKSDISNDSKFCNTCGALIGENQSTKLDELSPPIIKSKLKNKIIIVAAIFTFLGLAIIGLLLSTLDYSYIFSDFSRTECAMNGEGMVTCRFMNTGRTKGSRCRYAYLKTQKIGKLNNKYKDAELENILSGTREILLKNKYRVTGENLEYTYISAILNSDDIIFSKNEICSGLIEAGDVKEITEMMKFGDDGLTPNDLCKTETTNWNESCGWGMEYRETIVRKINEKIQK